MAAHFRLCQHCVFRRPARDYDGSAPHANGWILRLVSYPTVYSPHSPSSSLPGVPVDNIKTSPILIDAFKHVRLTPVDTARCTWE